jgi:hypothetical protein
MGAAPHDPALLPAHRGFGTFPIKVEEEWPSESTRDGIDEGLADIRAGRTTSLDEYRRSRDL